MITTISRAEGPLPRRKADPPTTRGAGERWAPLLVAVGRRQSRLANAGQLRDLLRDVEGVELPSSSPGQPHTYLYFPVIFTRSDRYEVGRRYAQFGIETKWRYYPLHMQRDFSDCRWSSLKTTEHCWRNHLLLPVGPSLTTNDVSYIARCTEMIATGRDE